MKKLCCLITALLIGVNLIPLTIYSTSNSKKSLAIPMIDSQTAVVIDADTKQVLFDKSKNKRAFPASTTKILTALIAIENKPLDSVITMSEEAVFSIPRSTSHIALDTNEQLTLEEALYATMLMSANDASNGIAEYVGGSNSNFAIMMNERAVKAGAVDSNFTNPHGLPEDSHYTTAYDLALISRDAWRESKMDKFWGNTLYDMEPTNKQKDVRHFANQHTMLKNSRFTYKGAFAGKVGWTEEAGHTLVTVAKRGSTTLICVTMNASTGDNKYKDTVNLLDYAFDNFSRKTITAQDIPPSQLQITADNGDSGTILLEAQADFEFLAPQNFDVNSLNLEYQAENLEESSNGSVIFTFDDFILGEIPMKKTVLSSTAAIKVGTDLNNLLDFSSLGFLERTGLFFKEFFKILIATIIITLFIIVILQLIVRYYMIRSTAKVVPRYRKKLSKYRKTPKKLALPPTMRKRIKK
ncbi:MAG: D-alanyl-D-alanine carboxypeptidase family protein [Oscillospiraceae bacterium]